MSSIQTMPMVFCASLPPWPRLYAPADTSCRRRNQRSTRLGVARLKVQATAINMTDPSTKPSNGATKMKTTVFITLANTKAEAPALDITAPTIPPMSACEELLGMP